MKEMKSTVYSALTNDSALSNLIDDRVIFYALPDSPTFPCLTYYEQNNSPALVGDGKELTSESVMVIDVWSKGSTTTIAQAVDSVMASLHFVREFAGDLSESGVHHKSMRYRHKSRR